MKIAFVIAATLTLSACASNYDPSACAGPHCLTVATAPAM